MPARSAAAKKPEKIDRSLWLNDIPRREWWPWERIRPYPNNARTHPPEELALLRRMIVRFGPDQPIVVDEAGVILKGHGRRLSVIDAFDGFWVKQRRGLSEVDKREMRIADNAVPLLAGWDRELMRGEIAFLKTEGFPIAMLGFGDVQIVHFESMPAPPAGGFPAVGENIAVEHSCPRCGYLWSGSSAPPPPEPPKKPRQKRKKK